MLASPGPSREAMLARPRRRAVPIAASAALSSVAFAGVLAAAMGGLPESSCAWQAGCEAQRVAAAPVSAGKPSPAIASDRVADAGDAQLDTIASPPVIQGRSVSEAGPEEAPAPTTAPDVAEPKRRGHRHRHHWWMR